MKKLVENQKDLDLKLLELATLNHKFRLMFDEEDKNYNKIKEPLILISKELNKVNPEPSLIGLERENLLKIANDILQEQRHKIIKLSNEAPLI